MEAVNARDATLTLLATRAHGTTLCPSEVARGLAAAAGSAGEWRAMMPLVHAAIDGLVAERRIRLSWKGQPLGKRAGPYRIGRIDHD